MLLLEKDTRKKKRINKLFLKSKPEFDASNNKKYKIEAIRNSIFYVKEAKRYLSSLYYLVYQKNYSKEEST